ncbi:MAG: acetylxylan esterase [Bryobacterales bacterium]|nr:acetylxylan esterase [Bryobacterales bacterium]
MKSKVSRRQLVAGATGLAAAQQALAQMPVAAYASALDGFEPQVNMGAFDPVAWTRERYKQMPLALTFKATTKAGALAWQKSLRTKLVELVGGFPARRAPLAPQTLEVREFPRYRREKFVIATQEGMGLLGYLLTPKDRQKPHPAMICVPGHGRGVDDIVGIDDKGRDRTGKAHYQYDFAIQAVEHGMAAVAIEPMAFGCRRDALTRRRGLSNSACQPTAGAAFLFGQTMIGWRVYDVMRVCDWIETRPELDARRIGLMGISGGGTVTTFGAALEPRIHTAFISGYLNTFLASIISLAHCIDNYVPGILNWCEMYDVAGLIAPRALFVESGDKDNIFPVEASRDSFARVAKVYEVFGAGGRAKQEVFPGEHQFHGVEGLPFCAKSLGVG